MALESIETLVEKINKLHAKNWRIEIHVIGDRSVDLFLGFDCYQHKQRQRFKK